MVYSRPPDQSALCTGTALSVSAEGRTARPPCCWLHSMWSNQGLCARATPLSLAQCGCTESGVSTTCSLAACVGWAAWVRRRATWWRVRLSLVENKTAWLLFESASLKKSR